jgi:hypothetical protein
VTSAILTASITGAGLLIAIYALITPISNKIFRDRVESHRKLKQEFDKMKGKISSESSDKEFKRLQTLASEIKQIEMFPKYLGIGVVLVFFGYISTAIFALTWLVSPPRESVSELPITIGFFSSTFGFFIVGLYSIYDVYRAMKREYEQMKKEKEEIEKSSKELAKVAEGMFKTVDASKKKLKNEK